MAIRRHYTDGPFGQVHYLKSGNTGSPAILFLHQTPSNSVMYEALMSELGSEYFCLAPDNPGFGASDPAPVPNSVSQYAASAVSVLDERGVDDCLVFGHHSGAGVAVQLAVDNPARVNGLVLSGPPLVTEKQRQALLASATDLPPSPDGSHLAGMWSRIRGKAGSSADVPLALSQRETLSALLIGELYSEAYRAVLSQPLGDLLPKVRCHTLLMAGDRDVLLGSLEPCAALLPRSEIHVVANAATYICEQDADRVAALIRCFPSHG